MIQFRQGEIQSITVTTQDLKPLAVVYRRQRYVKEGLIAATPYGVEFFRLNYTTLARRKHIPLRDLLQAARKDLMTHYRLRFDPLMNGIPGVWEYQGQEWFTMSGQSIMTLDGKPHEQLRLALARYDNADAPLDRLKVYANDYHLMITEGKVDEDPI